MALLRMLIFMAACNRSLLIEKSHFTVHRAFNENIYDISDIDLLPKTEEKSIISL